MPVTPSQRHVEPEFHPNLSLRVLSLDTLRRIENDSQEIANLSHATTDRRMESIRNLTLVGEEVQARTDLTNNILAEFVDLGGEA
jgi:hypothetical protein